MLHLKHVTREVENQQASNFITSKSVKKHPREQSLIQYCKKTCVIHISMKIVQLTVYPG